MQDTEVNKVIAGFMGRDILRENVLGKWYYQEIYTKSIDALIPVWDRLKYGYSYTMIIDNYYPRFNCGYRKDHLIKRCGHGNTLQQAAAYATAKAIMELKNES